MPIDLKAIGRSRTKTNLISPRWALAYASSLNLTSPAYLDDTRAADLVIAPTFCVCLEWTLSDSEVGASLMGTTPQEQRMRVHALQDSRFYAPFRLGMHVKTTSTLVHMRQTRAGTLALSRFTHADDDSGKLLCVSYASAILRGVSLGTDYVGEIPSDFSETSAPPEHLDHAATVEMARSLPHIYSECARIWNPIHTERAVALAAGLEDIIVHGTITWALAAREICGLTAAGDLLKLRRLAANFRSPIIAGRPMSIFMPRTRGQSSIAFNAKNDREEIILGNGVVELST